MNGLSTESNESAFAPESAKEATGVGLPFPVRIVAWTYIVCGALSVLDVVVALIQGELNLNLGVLGIFIGRGLLKRRNGWRMLAVGLSRLAVGCGGFILIAAITIAVMGKLTATVSPSLTSFAASVLALVALLVFSVWQYRILTRSDIVALFLQIELSTAGGAGSSRTSRFQYSLGTLMLITVVVALTCWRLSRDDVLYDGRYSLEFTSRLEGVWNVEFGGRTHRFLREHRILDYVVFTGSREDGAMKVTHPEPVAGFRGRTRVWTLERLDGTSLMFPGKVQLVEIVDGRYRESDQRISFRQLEAFLKSGPDSYTIDTLLQFVQEHPEIE